MNKKELITECKKIILNTNGGNDDYVVALCRISNAISELEDGELKDQRIKELEEKLKDLEEENDILKKYDNGEKVELKLEINNLKHQLKELEEENKRLENMNNRLSQGIYWGNGEHFCSVVSKLKQQLKELEEENSTLREYVKQCNILNGGNNLFNEKK